MDRKNYFRQIEKEILPEVEKPGRYLGNELNSVHKERSAVQATIVLAYPDIYDIGMSYYGFQILYHVLNRNKDIAAERVFAPWPDYERKLRERSLSLVSLESQISLAEFDILGFTLPYEMTYTNVLNMLDLARVALFSRERRTADPIVAAGGCGAYNPEPLAPFIDLFIIGDSEELVCDLVLEVACLRRQDKSREDILRRVADHFPGIYVPRFYHCPADDVMPRPVTEGVPMPVVANRTVRLKPEYYPLNPVVPLIQIAQDRYVIELMRGCTQECRFCQAGMIYRPVRERSLDDILSQTHSGIRNSGYDDVSYLSLSAADYSDLKGLSGALSQVMERNHFGISLPSMRLDSFTEEIARLVRKNRKSGLTFAPETGTDRLRRVINKKISDADLLESVDIALMQGWRTIKLYFMLGLPTETEDDVRMIASLVERVVKRGQNRLNIHVTLSTFIPKPHTPFQWEGQDSPSSVQSKIDLVKRSLRRFTKLKIMSRDPYYSQLEGVLARGDRKIGRIIHAAWQRGARMDAWREYFNRDSWEQGLKEIQIDPGIYTASRSPDAHLPWDHIDARVARQFLLEERERAYREETTKDCRYGCYNCGVCSGDDLKMDLVEPKSISRRTVRTGVRNYSGQPTRRLRLAYQKTGAIRFISHMDTLNVLIRALRSTDAVLKYTQGYNRRPKISAGFPLPLGYQSREEFLDLFVYEYPEDMHDRLNGRLPNGLKALGIRGISPAAPALFADITGFDYELILAADRESSLRKEIDIIMRQEEIIVERSRKGNVKALDIRPFIDLLRIKNERVMIRVKVVDGRTVKVSEIVNLLGLTGSQEVWRMKTYFRSNSTSE